MKLRVQLFAAARQTADRDAVTLDVPDGANVAAVRRALLARLPALEPIVAHARWAVEAQFVDDDHPISERSEIALIPPVSGG